MLAKIEEVRSTESPVIQTARDEIKRLRSSADTQIANSQTLIQKLREEIKIDGGADVDVIIDEQTARIKTANTEIDTLTEEKYTIEAEYRKLEAEVGPIKYIAEFIYEEADRADVMDALIDSQTKEQGQKKPSNESGCHAGKAKMLDAAKASVPNANIDGVLIQEVVSKLGEALIGLRRDNLVLSLIHISEPTRPY